MAYVTVPKDLTKVKNKLAFNLTKRQLVCIGIGACVGMPVYFLTKGFIGTSNAATLMMILMIPGFFFAMYEKDGMHLEQILANIINVRLKRPAVRRYETENRYEKDIPAAKGKEGKKGGRKPHGKRKGKHL